MITMPVLALIGIVLFKFPKSWKRRMFKDPEFTFMGKRRNFPLLLLICTIISWVMASHLNAGVATGHILLLTDFALYVVLKWLIGPAWLLCDKVIEMLKAWLLRKEEPKEVVWSRRPLTQVPKQLKEVTC
jgi:hypothetical protein